MGNNGKKRVMITLMGFQSDSGIVHMHNDQKKKEAEMGGLSISGISFAKCEQGCE